MTHRQSLYALAAATLLALGAPAAMAEPLTYDAALKLAAQSAPSLAAKSADIDAAHAARIAAGRLPDPKLRIGMENFPTSGPPAGSLNRDSMTMATVGVVQEMPNGSKRAAAREQADADIDVAAADQAIEARKVRLGTALAWIDLFYANRQLAALDDISKAIAPIRKSAPSQVAAGSLRAAQALDAESQEAALADQRADLVAKVSAARAELVRWTGDATAEVTGSAPDFAVNPGNLRALLDQNPRLVAYEAMGRRADADVALARADKHPDWGWDVTFQNRDPRYGDMVSAGVTISLPLFSGTRQDPVIEARNDTANRVRLERDATHRELEAQLESDLADHAMHHDRLMRAEATLVPLAQKKADLERASYAAGNASLGDVLQAQLALADAKIDLLAREADAVRDGIRINLIYGGIQ